MTGRADELHPAVEGLVVGAGAGKRRERAVVDVEDPVPIPFAELRAQDLHVTRQHHHLAARLVDTGGDLRDMTSSLPPA